MKEEHSMFEQKLLADWRLASKPKTLLSLFCILLLTCSVSLAQDGEDTEEFEAEESSEVSDADEEEAPAHSSIGPSTPIGHSLKSEKARKRIEELIATNRKEVKGVKLEVSQVAGNLPELVNGQYGFQTPEKFEGIPKAFVSLGDVSPTYGIVVEKLHHRLSVFKLNDRKYERVATFRAITGKDPGDKTSRGDFRTPEGIYFITGQMKDRLLPPKYGRLAFTLDYPNIYDQRQRKSGNGIWIHATDDPKRLQKPFDTEGCVAVSNEDILELQKYIIPFETPVVITKEMTSGTADDADRSRSLALDMVDSWRHSWESSSFEKYDEFYSKNFKSLGRGKGQWQNYKKALSSARKGDIKVTISEPKILAFEDQLLVVFLQNYQSPKHKDFGRKFLYLQWEGDRYRIIAEKWYPARKTETVMRTNVRMNGQM